MRRREGRRRAIVGHDLKGDTPTDEVGATPRYPRHVSTRLSLAATFDRRKRDRHHLSVRRTWN